MKILQALGVFEGQRSKKYEKKNPLACRLNPGYNQCHKAGIIKHKKGGGSHGKKHSKMDDSARLEMNKRYMCAVTTAFSLFAAFTVLVLTGLADSFNGTVAGRVQALESPALTVLFKVITNMGDWFVYLPVALLLFAIPKTRHKVGLPIAAALSVSAVLNELLKMLFAVPRPDTHRLIEMTGYSYPSGHAMNGATFICVCLMLFLRSDFRKEYKAAVSVFAPTLLFLLGLSRVYLGVHNPIDVLAGYAAGVCVGISVIIIVDSLRSHS